MIRRKHEVTINTACVAVALVTYTALNRYLAPQIQNAWWAAPLLSAIASLGLYATLFAVLQWFYANHLQDILLRRTSLPGEWYYILLINGQEVPRIGRCTIARNDGSLYLSGTHFHPTRKAFTSNFSSLAFQVDFPGLYVRYIAQGIRNKELDKSEGVFFLQIEGAPPKKIHGFWADVVPTRNTGSITLLKQCADVEKEMLAFGYPVGISEAEIVFGQLSKTKPQ